MEHSGTRRGLAAAGLIATVLLVACSAPGASTTGSPGLSASGSPIAVASPEPTPTPTRTPMPSPMPTPEPSPTADDGERDPDTEPSDDLYAEPGLDACGPGVETFDGSTVVACREGESRTSVERYDQDGDMVAGWPVVLDGVLVWNTWNDFTIGCGREVGDVARGPGDSILVAVQVDDAAAAEMDWVIRLISEVRGVRAEMNVPPAAQLRMLLRDAAPATRARLQTHLELIRRLARLDDVAADGAAPPNGAVQLVIDEATVMLPLADVIDVGRERTRLTRDIDKLTGEAGKIEGKLANAQFVAKAPPEVIEEQRDRLDELRQTVAKLATARERLSTM